MNTNELKELVELYIDNELEKSKEPLLFSSLAADDDAREYFFSLNVIRNAVEKDIRPFPSELDERIFNSLKDREKNQLFPFIRQRPFVLVPAAAAVFFILVSVFLFIEMRNYQQKVDSISEQINVQNRTIELILNNSLPPAEVRGRSINEIIVRANL